MFWNEDEAPDDLPSPEEIVDALFTIECRRIPVDHAYHLANALESALPWLKNEPRLGIHNIHVAGSQNGWERPEHGEGSMLMVSKRTKLTIRAPRQHAESLLEDLPGARLDIAGQELVVGTGKLRPLSQETTLFARYVASANAQDTLSEEERFLEGAASTLSEMGIRMRKALCGKSNPLYSPGGTIHTRSLMLADLTKEESLRLQQEGLGPHRRMGCGIFIPHKGIDPVKKSS